MALAYAFINQSGISYGEPNPRGPEREFSFFPPSGPFAGQELTVHASTWDGIPSGTWLPAWERWGRYATTEVEELLGMERPSRDPRAG